MMIDLSNSRSVSFVYYILYWSRKYLSYKAKFSTRKKKERDRDRNEGYCTYIIIDQYV